MNFCMKSQSVKLIALIARRIKINNNKISLLNKYQGNNQEISKYSKKYQEINKAIIQINWINKSYQNKVSIKMKK